MAGLFLFMKRSQIQSLIELKSSIVELLPNHFFTNLTEASFKNILKIIWVKRSVSSVFLLYLDLISSLLSIFCYSFWSLLKNALKLDVSIICDEVSVLEKINIETQKLKAASVEILHLSLRIRFIKILI